MLQVIEYKSLQDIINNIDYYSKLFLDNGIIVFRNANLNESSQKAIQEVFGSALKIFPNLSEERENLYREEHTKRASEGFGGDEIMLPWHMEHPQYPNPICVGFWNMMIFNIDSEMGKTYFLNMEKFFNSLSEEEKTFAAACKIKNEPIGVWDLVGKHYFRNTKVIRSTGGGELLEFNGQSPTKDDLYKFQLLTKKIKEHLDSVEDRIVLKWQKGDLAIVDIYIMAHAVTGGFLPGERKFTGLWSFHNSNLEMNELRAD